MVERGEMAALKHRRALIKRILASGIAVLILMVINIIWINPGFATKAHLKFHYGSTTIDTEITGADLETLKDILHGFSWYDGVPACGFDDSVSVTLTNGRKSIMFCPACDGDELFRIGNTGRYLNVSKEQRKLFNAIVKKYGMTFPCV